MKTHRSLISFFFLLSFWSCRSNDTFENTIEENGAIFFTIENNEVLDLLKYKSAKLAYLGTDAIMEVFEFGNCDSLNIKIPSDTPFLEIAYSDNSQIKFYYFVQKGDSIRVNFKDKQPWLEVTNRSTRPLEINFELHRNRGMYASQYSRIQDFYLIWDMSQNHPDVEFLEDLQESKSNAAKGLLFENLWIDSVFSDNSLPENSYKYFKDKNRFELKKLTLFNTDSTVNKRSVLNALSEVVSLISNDDKLYQYEFADMILDRQDEFELVDSVLRSYFSGGFGDVLLYKYLERKIRNLSFVEVDDLLEAYQSELRKSWKFRLAQENDFIRTLIPDMELEGAGGERLNFEDLLAQKRGKYLYVDLWAAWCIPCIRSFPASLALNEEWEALGFEVIYLSIDANKKYWKESVKKNNIDIPRQSFQVLNENESDFLAGLEVQSIPRYLIFDREGEFIHPNAPKPDNKEDLKKFIKDQLD